MARRCGAVLCLRLTSVCAFIIAAAGTGARGRGRAPVSLLKRPASEEPDNSLGSEQLSNGSRNLLKIGRTEGPMYLQTKAERIGLTASQKMELTTSQWGDGPWKPADQPKEASKDPGNLCIDGHLLPELYLLGAPKSSTTTFALDLIFAGIWRVHDQWSDKEFHFFDGMMEWEFKGDDGFEAQRTNWMRWFPECPTAKRAGLPEGEDPPRRLLADFTPDYMRMVPLPLGSKRFGTFPPWSGNGRFRLGQMPAHGDTVVSLPPILHRLYGEQGSKRVAMIALLREPLARMQSAWYHAQSFNFTNECVDCKAPNFRVSLREHLAMATKNPPTYTDWVWTGMYGHQLERWLHHFEASRLFVVPMGYLMKGDKDAICRRLSQHVRFNIDCDSKGRAMDHEWSHPHPPMSEDIGKYLQDQFSTFMEPHTDHLVKVLSENSLKGTVLATYEGQLGNHDAVKEWLVQGW